MIKRVFRTLSTTGLVLPTPFAAFAAESDRSLEPLQGKWSVARTNREGGRFPQVIEIKNDNLTFQIVGENDRPRFFARGTVKAESVEPFQVLRLSGIQAGPSMDELKSVDSPRASIYVLRDGKLVIASNFDRERENESPGVETYGRVATSNAGGAGDARDVEGRLLGKWKAEVVYDDNNLDYDLRISKAD